MRNLLKLIGISIYSFLNCVNCDVVTILKQPIRLLEPPYGVIHHHQDTTSAPTSPFFPQLPEIIINRSLFRNNDNGVIDQAYVYEQPNYQYLPPSYYPPLQPQQTEEFPPPNNIYLPPTVEQTPAPQGDDFVPENEYLPPQQDRPEESSYSYIPPETATTTQQPFRPQADEIIPSNENPGYNYDAPSNGYLPPTTGSALAKGRSLKDSIFFRNSKQSLSPIRLDLNDLKCRFDANGYFKSIITIQSFIDTTPIIDNANGDAVDKSLCDVRLVKSQLIVNIKIEDFHKCGIKLCDKDLCLRLRFPQIRDMKTLNDPVLVLKCKIQEKIITKTHAFKFGVNENFARGRSAGIYAQGGAQQPLRSQIGLFRRADDGSYTRPLELGGKVQLGEELMLRTQIQSGDGWNFTKISDISLQRLSSKGELLNSATLISANGCVNPKMQSICSAPPVFEPPLGYRFGFRAAMFQGMHSGDEVIMNIKVYGCLDRRDCQVDAACDSNGLRSKRDVGERKLLENSSVSFRIEMPEGRGGASPIAYTKSVPFWTIGIVALSCGCLLLIIIYVKFTYRRNN